MFSINAKGLRIPTRPFRNYTKQERYEMVYAIEVLHAEKNALLNWMEEMDEFIELNDNVIITKNARIAELEEEVADLKADAEDLYNLRVRPLEIEVSDLLGVVTGWRCKPQ